MGPVSAAERLFGVPLPPVPPRTAAEQGPSDGDAYALEEQGIPLRDGVELAADVHLQGEWRAFADGAGVRFDVRASLRDPPLDLTALASHAIHQGAPHPSALRLGVER